MTIVTKTDQLDLPKWMPSPVDHNDTLFWLLNLNAIDFSLKVGKLYLVYLAGSWKIEKTGSTGNTLEEEKWLTSHCLVLA